MVLIYVLVTISFLIFLHWASQFVFQGVETFPRLFLAFLLIGSLLGFQLFAEGLSLREVFAVVIWFLFLTELYLFIFTLSLGSISIKILQLLRTKPITAIEVENLYKPTSMSAIRFQRLVSTGLVQGVGENLELTDWGKRILSIFSFIKTKMHSSPME